MPNRLAFRDRPVMGQMPEAAHVEKVSHALVETAVGVSRSLPRGIRPAQIRKLEEQLLDKRSVTLPRVLRLALFAHTHGADVAPVWREFGAVFNDGRPAVPVIPLRQALICEVDVKCEEMPVMARVMCSGDATGPELRDLREKLVADRMALDLAIESVDAELNERRLARAAA